MPAGSLLGQVVEMRRVCRDALLSTGLQQEHPSFPQPSAGIGALGGGLARSVCSLSRGGELRDPWKHL